MTYQTEKILNKEQLLKNLNESDIRSVARLTVDKVSVPPLNSWGYELAICSGLGNFTLDNALTT